MLAETPACLNVCMIDASLSPLLAYPCQDVEMIQSRLEEATLLGIQSILHAGNEQIRGLSMLGKGYCGVVLLARWLDPVTGLQLVAVKVRRPDAPKPSLEAEARGMAIANRQGIGPKLYAYSQNFMVMDYLDGPTFYQWLHAPKHHCINLVLQDLLEQSYRLDCICLDHGNLRCVTEHVFIQNDAPILIDFSSSSCDRRPANVTTLTQGLFWGTKISSLLKHHRPLPDRDQIIPILRSYKAHPTAENFQRLFSVLFESSD